MSGLSATNLLVQPLRTPGGGAGVIESPIPAAPLSEARPRQEVKAVRPVAAVTEERGQPRPTASQGREANAEGTETRRSHGDRAAAQPTAVATLRQALGSAAFAAQLLGQGPGADAGEAGEQERLRASDAYRRSGGAPPLFPEAAAVFSLAV